MNQSKPRVLTGALIGLLLTAALTALMNLGSVLVDLPLVPFDLFDWVTRVLPGPLVTFGIDSMIKTMLALGINVADTAKSAEHGMAFGMFLGGGTAAGLALFAILRRGETPVNSVPGLIAGAIMGLPAIAISILIGVSSVSPVIKILYLLVAFLGWGASLGWIYRQLALAPVSTAEAANEMAVEQLSRRQFLIRAGATTAAITVVGAGVSVGLVGAARRRTEEASAMVKHSAESIDPSLGFPNANDPILPVPGTRPEYTPIKDHYRIFIRTRATEIDPAGYTLPISGMVDNMLILTLDDLRNNYPVIHRYVTLSCISNNVGGNLIGTTLWSGASLKQVLADAGVQPGAKYVQIHGGDGFYETVSLELINSDERIMLAYDWDSAPIPFDHGAPLRIYIPDRYGMKQPKWITSIEVIEENRPGYWVDRGWDEIAQMRATSVIDTVALDAIINDDDQRLIPIGGIAHAGDRGVSKVEVSVDGGEWAEAELRSPLSDTTWVIWRHEWPFAAGDHIFEVRMTEGDGSPQLSEINPPHPSGATGIHKVNETIG